MVQLLNISPAVVGWLLTLTTSVVVDFVVVVVGITASTVVVKEESVPACNAMISMLLQVYAD